MTKFVVSKLIYELICLQVTLSISYYTEMTGFTTSKHVFLRVDATWREN